MINPDFLITGPSLAKEANIKKLEDMKAGSRKVNIELETGVRPDKDIGDVLFLLYREDGMIMLLMKMSYQCFYQMA